MSISKYDASFYASQELSSLQSARVILGLLFKVYRPQTVLDVGCGQGWWLAAAEELGCKRLTGIDGPWVDKDRLLSPKIDFSVVDLEKKLELGERFDLCICMEVAEHLSKESSRKFVESLCATSDVILFSAAIPLQGGTHHVNEQWQSYWAELFAAFGYQCQDLIRPAIWNDKAVSSWYRQNALLYARATSAVAECARLVVRPNGPIDAVHPDIYEGNLRGLQRAIDEPTLAFCLQSFGRWGRRQVRKFVRGQQ